MRIPNSFQNMKKRIMIDLDLTIHKYSDGYKDGRIYDDVIEGSREAIKFLIDRGYEVWIWTARLAHPDFEEYYNEQMQFIVDWLNIHDIPYFGITGQKLPAILYIDDHALHFQSWKRALIAIKKLEKGSFLK